LYNSGTEIIHSLYFGTNENMTTLHALSAKIWQQSLDVGRDVCQEAQETPQTSPQASQGQ